jgi:hypothetical protein
MPYTDEQLNTIIDQSKFLRQFVVDYLYSKTGECKKTDLTAPFTDEQLTEKARWLLAGIPAIII